MEDKKQPIVDEDGRTLLPGTGEYLTYLHQRAARYTRTKRYLAAFRQRPEFDTLVEDMQQIRSPSIDFTKIMPGLFISDEEKTRHPSGLLWNNITAIVSLARKPSDHWQQPSFTHFAPTGRHLWVRCADTGKEDLLVHMSRVCDFIDRMLETPYTYPRLGSHDQADNDNYASASAQPKGGSVLIYSPKGSSRAAVMVIVYLMRKFNMTAADALLKVRAKRNIWPHQKFHFQLLAWEQVGHEIWEDDNETVPKRRIMTA